MPGTAINWLIAAIVIIVLVLLLVKLVGVL
jgi:hypothetical protein